MNLVVGATGVLGTEVCRLLREKGKAVRGLVRKTASEEKKQALIKMGVQLVEGDLKDRASLESACAGVDAILSTATSIVSRQNDDSLIKTDRDGHLALIEAAEKAGVSRFVFVSFSPIRYEFDLQTAKRAVEDRLQKSRMKYTILRPTFFQEVWLGPHLGFDAANRQARIYGDGTSKSSWISFRDVAKFAVLSLETPATENKILPLGGPEDLSPLEVVKIFEDVGGKRFNVEHVPEEVLRSNFQAATDSTARTFAGLTLSYVDGERIPMQDILKMMPVRLRSIRDYANSVLGSNS